MWIGQVASTAYVRSGSVAFPDVDFQGRCAECAEGRKTDCTAAPGRFRYCSAHRYSPAGGRREARGTGQIRERSRAPEPVTMVGRRSRVLFVQIEGPPVA